MTDAGLITDENLAELWHEMAKAEKQADIVEDRLDAIHEELDKLLESLEPYNSVSQEQVPHKEYTEPTEQSRP